MRKKVFLAIGLALALTFSTAGLAMATSGACSWHGGVDCAAGAGIYGQVICNDGWTGSSVSYDSMLECEAYNQPSCPINATYNSVTQSCVCNKGYYPDQWGTNTCESAYLYCSLKYNADYDWLSNSCQCPYGDLYSSSRGQCVTKNQYCQYTYGFQYQYSYLDNLCVSTY